MAVVWPSKNNFANGDVLTAANMNDIADTLNVFNPTSATNGQVWRANGTGSGSYQTLTAGWTQLASQALNTLSTHTFSSISGSYDTLILLVTDAVNSTNAGNTIRPNNITGYCRGSRLLGNGGNTTPSDQTTIATNARLYDNSIILMYFPKYAATSVGKPYYGYIQESTNDASGYSEYNWGVFAGNNYDGAAISSLTILANAGTWTAGTATIFGV